MRVFLLAFLLFTIFISELFAKNEKNILIVNSYHRGFLYSENIIKGIEKRLYNHFEVNIKVLNMDYKRGAKQDFLQRFKSFYSYKDNKKYDLIIAIDKFAYNFLNQNYKLLFTKEQILYTGIESLTKKEFETSQIKNRLNTVFTKRSIIENVLFIQRVMPELKRLYIINDNLEVDKTKELLNSLFARKSFKFGIEYIDKSTINDLKKKFLQKKEKEAILFIKFYTNKDGRFYKDSLIERLLKSIKLPIFVTDDLYINKGVVGGKLVSLENLGLISANSALKIINDKQKNIHKIVDSYDYKFDSLKLREFKINPYYYFNNYTVINKPLDFFQRNKNVLEVLFLLFPLLVLLVIGLLHNIYSRRKTQKLLKERIDFDEILLNAIESPIFWINKNNQLVDFNKEFASLVDIPKAQLYLKKFNSFYENKNVRKIVNALNLYSRNPQKNSQFTFEDKYKNKKVYLIKQAKYKDENSNHTGYVTIFTDITKEKEIEKEKERNQEFLIQQSKLAEIGEIFSAIAHQWKAPLLEITTIAQESFYMSENNNKENESYVKDIMTQVKYMDDTINDFQDFIKPSNRKTKFDIHEAITSLLKIVDHNIRFNYIQVDINLQKGTNVYIKGYRNEFMQSLLNIINNAKDELVKKDFKDRFITFNIYNKDNYLIVDIKDNAGGIKPKDIQNIFNPYYSTKEDGSGIGLYMTKVIIEDKMNGKISVKNIDNGACFTLKLEQKR